MWSFLTSIFGRRALLSDPYESDLAFCTRLLNVYRELRASGGLLADLPAWTTMQFGEDLAKIGSPQQLQAFPRLQAALAGVTSYTPSKWLLEQELAIRQRRAPEPLQWDKPLEKSALSIALEALGEAQLSEPGDDLYESGSRSQPTWSSSDQDVYVAAASERLAGMCFSGGGIRSATFNLGILQGLASGGKLGRFDYLSTVSGGGYIHQWFASWIRNEPGRFATVQNRLKPLPTPGSAARAPEQITWLRRYSSYLTPRRGLLSGDTWAMFAIWFRNTFLNQIVLFSFLILCLVVARSITNFFTFFYHRAHHFRSASLGWTVFATLSASAFVFGRALASQSKRSTPGRPARGALSNKGVIFFIVLPGFLISSAIALEAIGAVTLGDGPVLFSCFAVYILMMLLAVTLGGKAFCNFRELRSPRFFERAAFRVGSVASVLALTVLTVILAAYICSDAPVDSDAVAPAASSSNPAPVQAAPQHSAQPSPRHSVQHASLGSAHPMQQADRGQPSVQHLQSMHGAASPIDHLPPAAQNVVPTVSVETKFSPRITILYSWAMRGSDFLNRALYSKVPAAAAKSDPASMHPIAPQYLYAIASPLVFFSLLFLAMRLQLGLLGRFYTEERREWLGRLGGWSAGISILWIILSAIGTLGPVVFYWIFTERHAAGRILGVAGTLVIHGITVYAGASGKADGKPKPNKLFGYSFFDLVSMIGAPLCILILLIIASGLIDTINARWLSGRELFLLVSAILLLFGWRVDVNEFSMHGFYRNRLARCYLGATNPLRSPDPFTGFDEHTEATIRSGMRLSELLPRQFGGKGFKEDAAKAVRQPYDGPFPIFCSTVNLTFGEDLAWQDRKGACFAFTPLYSGYHVGWTGAMGADRETTFNGYVPTESYAYPNGGIHLATATAISGAALSPNMGYNSQPAVAFLMTLFNARLGWWLANPRRPKVWPEARRRPTPRLGMWYLLSELCGFADDTSNYVCLSDGGHFENMGLYELVRRRCMLIVICDAECDTDTSFEGIGLAISKCRTDFGAEITLNLNPLIPADDGPSADLSAEHLIVGTIQYPAPPGCKLPLSRFLGKVIYVKTSITGRETADILHYRRTFPNFPQDSTLNQWFSETQFESYRRLGQLTGKEAAEYI